MRKFISLIVGLVVFLPQPSFSANWVSVTDDQKTFVDFSSIKKEHPVGIEFYNKNNIYSIWFKNLNRKTNKELKIEKVLNSKIWYSLTQEYIDCDNKKMATYYLDYYDLNKNRIYNIQNTNGLEWTPVLPESTGELVCNYVCGNRTDNIIPNNNSISEIDPTEIYKQNVNSVVFVLTNKMIGSGVIVKEDGTFVTCYHVIDGASSIAIKTNDGRVYKVNGYKYLNKEQDIAILTLDTNDTFKPMQFPTHKSLEIGSKVYTISNPEGVQFTFSDGILSQEYNGLLQFTAPASPGSSGGALLDEHGHLIGIITSQISKGQNINFATSNEVYYQMLNNPIIPYTYTVDYSNLTPNYYNNTTGTNPYQSNNACSYQKLQFLQSQYDTLKKELEEIVQNENYRHNVNLMGDARAAIFGMPKIRDVQPSRYESQRKLELEQQMRYYQQQIDQCLKGSSF